MTTAALLVVSYALMRRVRFQLGTGPDPPDAARVRADAVPHARRGRAGAGGARLACSGELPELLRRRAHPERLLVIDRRRLVRGRPGAGDRGAATGHRHDAPPVLLLLALAAQFASDLARLDAARVASARGISPAELLPVLALVYLIDALAGADRLPRRARHRGRTQYAYLLAIAPGALLGLIARERSGADRARARARARLPALHARARRARRGPAPPGRRGCRRGGGESAPARTAPRWSGCCSPPRSRRCRPTAGA